MEKLESEGECPVRQRPEPADLDAAARRIKHLAGRTAENILEIGRELLLVRKHIAHGAWEDWVRDALGWHPCTAWRFIRFAKLAKTQGLTLAQLWGNKPKALPAPQTSDRFLANLGDAAPKVTTALGLMVQGNWQFQAQREQVEKVDKILRRLKRAIEAYENSPGRARAGPGAGSISVSSTLSRRATCPPSLLSLSNLILLHAGRRMCS